jgi:uncharacterized protein (TIGR03086 family)
MDVYTLYHRSVETWADRVNGVDPDQWQAPTPCAEWSVRTLVNHVVGEDLWTVELMRGRTMADVGDALDGDILGDDPVTRAIEAAKDSVSVVADLLPRGEKVHLSYGDEDPAEYVRQLTADHLIHAWDLAAAIGGDRRLDPQLVNAVSGWFEGVEQLMREAGAIGPQAPLTGEAQADLLARAGRAADWGVNHATLARFSQAIAAGDVDGIMGLMTDDCVFESTAPAPDGHRYEGAAAVRQAWDQLYGSPGHVRGVDLLRFRDAKVAELLSYVKG